MSGRQAKLARREIRRAADPALRLMQEQQENAIKAVVERCSQVTYAHQILTAHIHNLEKRIAALEPATQTGDPDGQQVSSEQREGGEGGQGRAAIPGQEVPAEEEVSA